MPIARCEREIFAYIPFNVKSKGTHIDATNFQGTVETFVYKLALW